MPRTMLLACCVAALVATPAAAGLPDWLVGEWTRPSRNGHILESWRSVSDRTLEGDAWYVAPDGTRVAIEAVRLVVMGDGTFYIPRPRENPLPVAFRLVESGERRLVFENRDHDFPTRIAYELREDGSLLVWISGPGEEDAERRIEFEFTRVRRP